LKMDGLPNPLLFTPLMAYIPRAELLMVGEELELELPIQSTRHLVMHVDLTGCPTFVYIRYVYRYSK